MGNGTNSFDTSFDTGRVEREEIARKRQNVTGSRLRGDHWSFPICERHFCDLHVSRWKVIAISSSPRNFSSFRYWNLFLNAIRLFFYRVKNNNISEDEKDFVDRAKNPRLIQDISIIWIHRVLFERRMLSYNVSQSAETTENKHIQKMKIELILYPRNISFYRYIYRKCLQNIRKETGKLHVNSNIHASELLFSRNGRVNKPNE